MGLRGMLETGRALGPFPQGPDRPGHAIERGSAEWLAEAFLKTTGGDPQALLPLLGSFVDTSEDGAARASPCRRWSCRAPRTRTTAPPRSWPSCFPTRRFVEVPGNHMSAVTRPELGRAIADFLAA